jgi:hypothetical protein
MSRARRVRVFPDQTGPLGVFIDTYRSAQYPRGNFDPTPNLHVHRKARPRVDVSLASVPRPAWARPTT